MTREHQNNHNSPTLNKWCTADKIAAVALLINLGLAIFTYQLYSVASKDSKNADKSANAANKSAEIAQTTLNEIKDYNTKSLQKQQVALDRAKVDADKREKSDRENSIRQNKSVDAQIASLKETQTEFKNENEPYLQATNFVVYIDTSTYKVIVKYSLFNNGKQAVKATNEKVKLAILARDIDTTEMDSVLNKTKLQPYNDYISPKDPNTGIANDITINKAMYDEVRNGQKIMIYFGEINYINLITKAIKTYKYAAKISSFGTISYHMIRSDNSNTN
jgi:hypothetical protein